MRKLILLIVLFPLFVSSQEEFSFELYFEDALGNKDTLVLGYDPLATDSVDVAFGEVNIINQPWDNIFEVRASEAKTNWNSAPSNYQSKKQIIDKTCDFDFDVLINIVAMNYPVTIYWDTTAFITDSCRMASILSCCATLESDFYNGPSIFLSNKYQSLVHSGDSLVIDPNLWNGMLSSYNNGTNDISAIWLSFANPNKFPSTGIEEFDLVDVNIYPNPVSNLLSFKIENVNSIESTYQIYNSVGQLIQSGITNANQIDISKLPNGHYMLSGYKGIKFFKSPFIISR
jgi:hypothetical protein